MNAQERLISMLAIAAQARETVILWGQPGIGKTTIVEVLGLALTQHVETVLASIREPSDFGGLPIVSNTASNSGLAEDTANLGGEVFLAPPAWAKRIVRRGGGILFFDEISTAPPAVQAALLRVVLDRVVGDLELPKDVAIIAAANPPGTANNVWDLSSPLANRFCHIDWSIDADYWCDGMLSGFPIPTFPRVEANWKEGIAEREALIAGYIKRQSHHLLVVPSDGSAAGKAWPSPRSWRMAARLWAAADSAGADKEVRNALIAGCVGHVASEFFVWIDNLDLQDPEALLEDPTLFTIDDRGDRVFATLNAVVSAIVRRNTPERWAQGWKILGRALTQGVADLAAFAARVLANNRPEGLTEIPDEVGEFTAILRMSTPARPTS